MFTVSPVRATEALLQESVLHVRLNRPACGNALSFQMIEELHQIFDSIDIPSVRAVIIRGAGGNFCSGGDIKDMSELLARVPSGELESIATHNARAGELFAKIDAAPAAVIGILEGAVMGGGMGLACATDINICLANASFALPETRLGLIPAQVAPFVRRRLGESNARLLAVTGERFSAPWAEKAGLVQFLVDNEAMLQIQLLSLLFSIKACAPRALFMAKKLMSTGDMPQADDPNHLGRLFAASMSGEECREGTSAFMEKRKPGWVQ